MIYIKAMPVNARQAPARKQCADQRLIMPSELPVSAIRINTDAPNDPEDAASRRAA